MTVEHPYMDTAHRGKCDVCDNVPRTGHGPLSVQFLAAALRAVSTEFDLYDERQMESAASALLSRIRASGAI